jgi:flagellar L-ring protein precursor FlgH|tara:strand:+ start:420 stop:1043 length:624 start_codon:yes stop_codon:yes gene_type:complete
MMSQILKQILLIVMSSFLLGQMEDFSVTSIYSDIKAHNIGDLITVHIIESSNASRESKVNSSSSTDMSMDGSVAGTLTDYLPLFGAASKISNILDGSEGTEQKDQLTGRISVTIMEETENGMFFIKGKRILEVNGEMNTIQLEGYIRERDISTDNTVFSYNIANAEIIYRKGGTLENVVNPRKMQKWLTWGVGLGLVGLAFIGPIAF